MNAIAPNTSGQYQSLESMHALFNQQKSAFAAAPYPDIATRREALNAIKSALLAQQDALIEALSSDYGHRSHDDSRISDIMPVINHINYTLSNLKGWMKPSRRRAGMLLAPASIKVEYQPKGIIGIIVPWNFPIMLSLGPLVTAIAAGNSAMLKMSEFTPATNKVLKTLLAKVFNEDKVAIIEGEADIAAAFSSLPFDHLLFTGSTVVGKHVMRAASANLTPVTLELGGKSPVIVAPDMDMDTAVERLIYGKCLNAGQICVAPDYVLVPSGKEDAFIHAYQAKFAALYGKVETNKDYGAIINERQWQRLMTVLDDAKSKGAQVHSASGEGPLAAIRKLPTQLLTQVDDDMLVLQEEIFGPLLPIIPYASINDAITYINARPRPLALYLMSFDATTQETVLKLTHSGGVCINETVFHVAADDAPFGGIGPSGMGHYHGEEGFRTFSHAKTVLKRGRLNTGKMVHPPYGNAIQRLLMKVFLR